MRVFKEKSLIDRSLSKVRQTRDTLVHTLHQYARRTAAQSRQDLHSTIRFSAKSCSAKSVSRQTAPETNEGERESVAEKLEIRGSFACPKNQPLPKCDEHENTELLFLMQLHRDDFGRCLLYEGEEDLLQIATCFDDLEDTWGVKPLLFWANSKLLGDDDVDENATDNPHQDSYYCMTNLVGFFLEVITEWYTEDEKICRTSTSGCWSRMKGKKN